MSRSLKAHILLVLVTFAWGATFVSVKDALGAVSPLVFNALRMATASVALVVVFWADLTRPRGLKPQNNSRGQERSAEALLHPKAQAPLLHPKTIQPKTLDPNASAPVLQPKTQSPLLHPKTGVWAGGALLGMFLWAGYSFQTVGLKYTTASKSAFITGMAVVLVPLVVAISGRRLPNRWTLVGVAAAFAGLYLMTMAPTALRQMSSTSGSISSAASSSGPASSGAASPQRAEIWGTIGINFGDLLTLGCPISFALHIYTLGKLTQRYPFKVLSVVQVVVATVLMTATIPLERPRLEFTGQAVFAILFTGLICTAAAFSIQAWAQQFTPPTHTALIFLLEPVFAALTSYVLLGEHLGARGTIGAMLILGGILVSELKGSSVEPATEISIN